MKIHFYLGAIVTCKILASCSSLRGSLGDGEFNPLLAPGAGGSFSANVATNYAFESGQYVTAASNSTSFFTTKPDGNAEADELLAAGTSMRVIKTDGSFVKIELDSGKVGYVAGAMLVESGLATPSTTSPGTLPVTPAENPATSGDSLPAMVSPEIELPAPTELVPLPEPAGSGSKGE